MTRTRTRVGVLPPVLILDLGCCGTAAIQLAAPRYGVIGCGGGACELEPAQAGVMIVAGRVTTRLVPVIRALYEQLSPPRWVVACGTCAISGAMFDTLPLDQVIGVDVYVAGCPPPPEAIRRALNLLPEGER